MKPGADTQQHERERYRPASTTVQTSAGVLSDPAAGPWWRDAIGLLIAAGGAALCVQAYLQQHSLFMDEARLLENVLLRSWSELSQPLTQEQAAPVGFLYLLKLSIAWVGDDKLGFRAVPMTAAVASMFLFWIFIRQLVQGWPAWFGMAVFATGSSTTYYAQQAKQYTVELAVALAMLCLLSWIARRGLSVWRLAVFALAGAIGVWLSVTAVIVLAGCGVVLLVLAIRGKRPAMVAAVLGVGIVWVGSFLLQYWWVLREYRGNDYLINYWKPFYLRVIPQLPHRVFGQLSSVFIRPVDLQLHQLGFALWAVGFYAAVRSKRALPWALVVAWGTLALLSYLEHYPYGDRQVLFALPILIGLMVLGIAWLRTLGRPGEAIAIATAVAVVLAPVFTMGKVKADDDIEPVIRELRQRIQPGDIVWVDRGVIYMTQFLIARSDEFDLAPAEVRYSARIDGQRHWVLDEIQSFAGQPRVWLLLSHSLGREGVDEVVYVQLLAKQMGQKIDMIQHGDSVAALFDFTATPTPPPLPAGPLPVLVEPPADLSLPDPDHPAQDEGEDADAPTSAINPEDQAKPVKPVKPAKPAEPKPALPVPFESEDNALDQDENVSTPVPELAPTPNLTPDPQPESPR